MSARIVHPTERPNFSILYLPTINIAFSYETPIGYSEGSHWVVRHNDWGPTTGKHMNELGVDKEDRISGEHFEAQLSERISRRLPTGAYV